LTQLLTKWPYFLAFSVGVLTRLLYKPNSSKATSVTFILVAYVSASNLKLWAICGCAVFSYLCIQIGESKVFKRFSNFRDISYGMYLYHFPVIQILVSYKIFYHNSLSIYLMFRPIK
jgi:peptidoglycan/LPS O-acetylase OafA/YrhL